MENNSNAINSKSLIFILLSRLLLFVFFQLLIALILSSWKESEKYWLLTATFANFVSIILLNILLKKEGIKYFYLFQFSKNKWGIDLLITLGLLLISVPIILIPSLSFSSFLWGNTTYYHQVLFQPIPNIIIYFLLFAFPVTMCFADIPTYFGYIMPRLKNKLQRNWIAILLPVIFLSIQNCTLPLVFDAKFIFFRALMYLPYTLMFGIAAYKRPALLPYLAILYGAIYILPVITQLTTEY
ncbi:MAG: hypothetical protein WC358_04410 [Ignavibacteria bacterium]|jgi:hypothetical protein